MFINSSLDWQEVSNSLLEQMNSLPYNSDLNKLFRNISSMVTELSKLEVEARRLNSPHKTAEKIAEINSAIDRLEKLLLVAKLVG